MCRYGVIVWVLLVGTVSIAGVDFDPHDESDYIDDPEESPHIREPKQAPTEARSLINSTLKDAQDVIEKLLRQSMINYEDPVSPAWTRWWTPSTVSSVDWNPPVDNALYIAPVRKKGFTKPTRKTSSKTLGVSTRTWDFKTTRSKQHRTKEVVYSVHVPTAAPTMQNKRPGVIESLVGGHDLVVYEGPQRAGAGAYNLGGTRPRPGMSSPAGRRYLVQPPDDLTTANTRPPRPTPTTKYLKTTYKYTRLTRRHSNCTDNYYACLTICLDKKGYRVRCKHDTTYRAPPMRINMTGLISAFILNPLYDYDTRNIVESFKKWLLDRGYRTCVAYTTVTTTTKKVYPVYYDDMLSKHTGFIVAKCWVCGLTEQGIPRDADCSDAFTGIGAATALMQRNRYRKYCRWMEDVPLWFNRTDPFSVWGRWTGGCSYRWLDLTGLYTQRTCRSTEYPAHGHHYLSRRMATLELSLKHVKNGCTVSPMASLVPFSRAVSLYARFHVCVCDGNFCNRATRGRAVAAPIILALFCIRLLY